jgi:hypothetical protein
MLEGLFGNQNIERILMFLFVNGRCYGTQLHRSLKVALTPLQKAFQRLEEGGIIMSHMEGKTRLYQLNPAYPLKEELEQLLKKAYTLLPAQKKREYYIAKPSGDSESNSAILLKFWKRLGQIKQLTFHAKSKSKEELGWTGRGKGEVVVTAEGKDILIYNEKGAWLSKEGSETGFHNVFRWTLNRPAGLISLEHLRRGVNHPVFLFDLAPSHKQLLASVDSHLCVNDTYFGQMHLDPNSLRLSWRVIGPKKNEEIDYYYI